MITTAFPLIRCDTYWEAVLKIKRHLFQNKRNNSYKVSKLFCHFVFPNKNI